MVAAIACHGGADRESRTAAGVSCATSRALVERWIAADTAGAWNHRPGTSVPWGIADTVNEEGGGDAFTIAIPGSTTCAVLTPDSVKVAVAWQVIGYESAPNGKTVVFEEGVGKEDRKSVV